MIRFVILALVVFAAWFLLYKLYHAAKERRIDWTGVAFIFGFVVLAFYLRQQFGLG